MVVAAQDDGEAAEAPAEEAAQTADPPCSEPSPCPATDTARNPEVTCYEPHSTPVDQDVTLHIYGRHLTKPDAPPVRVLYRDSEMSGPMARMNEDIEVRSACHVVTTLFVEGSRRLSKGDAVEFRLQRSEPTREEAREGSKGMISEWHLVDVTAPATTGTTLEVDHTVTAETDSPCDAGERSAAAIREIMENSGRWVMDQVRIEGAVGPTNTNAGSDEKEYALRGETGSIRVTTTESLPEADAWYSVHGEVTFDPDTDTAYLRERDRTSCE